MTQLISDIFVPFSGDPKSKIYLVGEAPGEIEEEKGEPFVGKAGDTLNGMLMSKGIPRSDCFLCNISHHRPKDNFFNHLLGSKELRDGVVEVQNLILTNKPNLVVLLGAHPLEHILELNNPSITAYRGSILSYGEVKCIPTFHPSYIQRHDTPPVNISIWDMDWDRIKEDLKFPELRLPQYHFIFEPSWDLVNEYCEAEYLSADIENIEGTLEILCISFARNPEEAICIEYNKTYNTNIEKIDKLLRSKAKKIFQNGQHDSIILRENGHEINNYTDDTIIQAHVIDPELPRDLGFLCSIWTRQPYYKKSGRSNIPLDSKGWSKKAAEKKERLWSYCSTDAVVTFKVFIGQKEEIDKEPILKDTYDWEMLLQEMAIDMSLNGMLVDQERRELLRLEIERDWIEYQICLEALIQDKINANSHLQVKRLFYDDLKLPIRLKDKKPTVDDNALVSLLGYCKQHIEDVKKDSTKKEWIIKYHIVYLVNRIKKLLKRKSSYIDFELSEDGRARGTHKVMATETGRWGVGLYVDKKGVPLQTIPRD